MNNKEELAKEYVSHIPSGVYKILENDIDRMQWISETERAFESGYDAGKQENEHLVWKISEANFEKGKKESIDKACKFIQTNVREYYKSGVFHVAEFIKDLRKRVEG